MNKIAFIGVGIMGRSMVRNLMKAGFELHIYARTRSKVEDVISEGATFHDTIADCVKDAEAVITIVGFPTDVEEVYFDAGNILDSAKEGAYLIADYFRPMRDEALDTGLLNPKNLGVNIKTLLYQVPGGMLSNLTSQLKEQHAEDKFYDVLEEVPKVRKDLGEPPLVTPSSQIVGTQAVFNVLMGERYKMVTKETKDILLGKYGATVKPFNQDVQKKCIGDAKPITCRPADLLDNELDKLETEMSAYKEQDEDVLSYALFPQVATDFFKYRQAQEKKVDEKAADTENGAYPV